MADVKKVAKSTGKRAVKSAGSTAKPAVPPKKAAAPKLVAKPKAAVAAKPARARKPKPAAIPQEQRRNYIEVAAYYIAARRGFAPGDPLQDWIDAEAEIDRLLREGRLGLPPAA